MKFDSNKDKGKAGLAMAIGYYGSNGYNVSLPLNDTQEYDLIIDKEGQLYKIQVRSTGQITPSGNYIVTLRSCGGTKGRVYGRLKDTNIDFLFVLCGNGSMYHIPKTEIENMNGALTLSGRILPYQVYI